MQGGGVVGMQVTKADSPWRKSETKGRERVRG